MVSTATMRVLEPAPHVLAFYDGRVPGRRLVSDAANWMDDGGYVLGIATYAVVDDGEAVLFDTGLSPDHGRAIRAELERRGVRSVRVVLSHHHRDHVAGGAAFAECEIIALRATAEAMEAQRDVFAAGTPPIAPLAMPTTVFDGVMGLRAGAVELELHPYDIHSRDGLTMLLPVPRLLLAGDTLEDTVTYVAEPERLGLHLSELDRMARLDLRRILPCHGDPGRIAAGGYGPGLIAATRDYVAWLLALREDPSRADLPLRDVVAAALEGGATTWFAPYEAVHRANVAAVLAP
ncbi:MBL fold metallo-hydrolase [Oceaniglobus roseus]|uniref:MBL fold metallo-hydrolase n=1 Tax=Oceaniglobus roseus TaxID=1737570 RepID=UPI000C7F44BC|nr:MBL fold metallo-hydrolase [Kandeliimicrobium roseum]